MDVLKPETYWIGDRCYRKNPSRNDNRGLALDNRPYEEDGRSYAAPGPYVEEDDPTLCDPDAPDELEDLENYPVEKTDAGFKAKCDTIPCSLFPHIIGSKGSTKKRIEYETNTKIVVPRPNEKGDIVIRGQKEKDVRNARRRLELIASQSRFKREATHFACFPLNFSRVIGKMKEFKEIVLKECGRSSIRGLDESLFNEPEKIHLTLCVMVLLDEKERNLAADVLKKLEEEIKKITKGTKLRIRLKGLEIMNDDPTQVDVLYCKCVFEDGNNLVQEIADLTAQRFSETGFSKATIATRGEIVKLHCTIMNTRLRKEGEGEDRNQTEGFNGGANANNDRRPSRPVQRESFDASYILSKFNDFDFGTVDIQAIKLATRYTKGNDGFYKAYASISV